MKPSEVKALQQKLNAKGANLKVDGIYGKLTSEAYLKYESQNKKESMTNKTVIDKTVNLPNNNTSEDDDSSLENVFKNNFGKFFDAKVTKTNTPEPEWVNKYKNQPNVSRLGFPIAQIDKKAIDNDALLLDDKSFYNKHGVPKENYKNIDKGRIGYETTIPVGYGKFDANLYGAWQRDEDRAVRDEAFRIYSGVPGKPKYFIPSDNKPSVSKEDKRYLRLNDDLENRILQETYKDIHKNPKFDEDITQGFVYDKKNKIAKRIYGTTGNQADNKFGQQSGSGAIAMGKYTVNKGVDKNGNHFLSYYDDWDLSIGERKGLPNVDLGRGTSFGIYNKIYYDSKTGKRINPTNISNENIDFDTESFKKVQETQKVDKFTKTIESTNMKYLAKPTNLVSKKIKYAPIFAYGGKLPKYGYGMKIDSVFAKEDKSDNSPISLNALNTTKTNKQSDIVKKGSNTDINSLPFMNNTNSFTNKAKINTKNNKSNKIAEHWLSKGFSENAVKGILANIHRESNFNSGAIGDNGTSFGMYQHHADRRNKLFSYLDSKGLDRTDPFGQTDFAISELSPSLKRKLNNASTPEEAADLWVREFERPANVDKESKIRQGLVSNYKAYGGSLPKYGFGENLLNNPLLKNANGLKGLGATTSSTNSIQNGAVGLGFLASGIDSFNNSDNPDTSLSTISGALKGAATGASIGSIIPGVGTLIGGAVGGLVGGISANNQAKKQVSTYQKNLRDKNTAMKSYFTTQSNAMLASYLTNGVQGSYGYFKYGGCLFPKYGMGGNQQPEYEVEKDEVVQGQDVNLQKGKQIASDMHKVAGNTHEQGGTMGSGGERVFSNRLLITDDLSMLLKMGGFKFATNKTFADVATKLGKVKGKFEDKLHTNNHIKINTGKVMLDKINSLTELTFQAQEQLKENGDIPTFAYGGNLPKFADGGYLVKKGDTLSAIAKRNNTTVEALAKLNGIKNPNMIKEGQNINLTPSVASTITNPVVNSYDPFNIKNGGIPVNQSRPPLASANLQSNDRLNLTPTVSSMTPKGFSNSVTPSITAKQDALKPASLQLPKTVDSFDNQRKPIDASNLIGYGTSLMGYMNDLNTIKRMDTSASRNMIANPAFNYTDRSGIGRATLSSGLRSFVNNPNNNGTMNQMAFANYLKGVNQNNLGEAQRKNDYVNNYNRMAYQTNVQNTQTIQRADETERSLKNEQNQMYGQSFNNLLGNVGTVRLENDQKRLDKDKMELLKRTYDIKSNQGVSYMLDELRKKISAGTATPQDINMFKSLQG